MRRKEWMEEAKEERKKVTKKDRSEDRVGEEGGRKEGKNRGVQRREAGMGERSEEIRVQRRKDGRFSEVKCI